MSNSGGRILVIDDDQHTLDALRRLLAKQVDVVAVSVPQEAINRAEAECFEVVLTDLVMSGINGFEVINKLALISPATVCVILTGQIADPYPNGLPANVLTCLHKPCDFDRLVDVLQSALAEYVLRAACMMQPQEPTDEKQDIQALNPE